MTKFSVEQQMRHAKASERKGAYDEAKQIYESILERFPNNARANQALTALETAGQPSAALAAMSDDAEKHIRLGIALRQQGRIDDAIGSFREAARLRPRAVEPHLFAGLLLKDEGRYEEAIESFRSALRIKPDSFEAHCGCGIALMHRHKLDEACKSFERAEKIKPDFFDAYLVHGYALKQQGKFGEAIESFERALRIRPDSAETLRNLGGALKALGKFGEAFERLEQASQIEPENGVTLTDKLWLQLEMCDWKAFDEFEKVSSTLGIDGECASPWILLPFEDQPERQAKRSRHYVHQSLEIEALPLPAPAPRQSRLRIGYFSADFHDHPVLHVLSGLFREHDRQRFEVFAFSLGPDEACEQRESLKRNVDHFIDIRTLPDQEAIAAARLQGLDIAIDLMGYTKNARPGLFAGRLAPIQVNYLGFAGTTGADYIDYIIGDTALIPESERQFYSEAVIDLPNSYFPYDDRRPISGKQTTRAEAGLPDEGFVFCCFNQAYKIGPREFDIWMRLLGKIDGSVLWLSRTNEWAASNLRREAVARGIAPDRLIFAPRTEKNEDHLARHRHAGLFIDTFNYNAHTTACDALWTGLPVVTKAGRQFSARVSASLLTAIGLPELITENEEGYEALIFELATNPDRLAATRAKLAQHRTTQPLFDTARYTRDFENALEAAHDRCLKGVA